jgi:hypothetical protein
MNAALEVIKKVEANGGRLWAEDGWIVIEPAKAAAPLIEELKAFKPEILKLLQSDSAGMDAHDPACWQADFTRWLAANCVSREGKQDSQSVGSLHVDFCEWATTHDSVPCRRSVFEQLLASSGLCVADGLVQGLALLAEIQAHEDFAKHTAQVKEHDARISKRKKK